MKKLSSAFGAALFAASAGPALAAPPPRPTPKVDTINMMIDEEPVVPALARSLGCLERERLALNVIDVDTLVPGDYQMQVPLNDGRIDMAYHWFNHTVFGARHKLPIVAVMNFNDAPGMTVFVNNAKAGEIRSASDFRGRTVASGAIYGTKSMLTYALAAKAGVAQGDYRQVATAEAGRQKAIEAGLADKSIDVVTSEEPFTTAYRDTHEATPLFSIMDRHSTTAALGATWPAQSLLMSTKFLAAKPRVAQRAVNAFVCVMRFVNAHDPAAIVDRLPADYLQGKDRAQVIESLARAMPTYAGGDYRFRKPDAAMVARTIEAYEFDDSKEGQWRSFHVGGKVDPATLYDNSLVNKAMARIK